MNKRLLSLLIVMLAMTLPTKLWAQEPYAVLSENNTVLTFYYDGNKANRNGFDLDYTNSWNDQRESITIVVFDDSFANCLTLTRTAFWFMSCSKLTTIIGIENLKTDNVTDMNGMFYGCSSLKNLDVSGFKTDNVTNMGIMFYGCSGLSSLDVSHFNTEKVTNMNAMFSDCSGLSSLDVSHFNTENVTNMSGMFSGCSDLTSLDVSHFNTSSVTDMSSMFSDCSSLTSLDVSNFNTTNVTNMMCMFCDCFVLKDLDVSGFKTDNVTNMNGMFDNCSGLTSLDVSNFNTANVTDMGAMFNVCHSLKNLVVSNFNTEKVTNMASMFHSCSGLTSLDVSGFKTDNVTDMQAMFYDCSGLESLDVSNFNTSNVTNMSYMFASCLRFKNLDVSGFKTDNVTNMGYMFYDCSDLKSMDLSNFKTDNVTDMSSMFSYCSNLQTIYVEEGWSTAKVEVGNDMFYNCTSLVGGAGTKYDANHTNHTYAHIDGGPTNPGYFTDKNVPIEVEAYAVLSDNGSTVTFYYDNQKIQRNGMEMGAYDEQGVKLYASATKAVFDPSFANDTTLTTTSAWFYGCDQLKEISGLQYVNTSKVTNMANMFQGCRSLQTVDVSKFDTRNVENMNNLFDYCSSLTSLDLSNFNTEKVTTMDYMFVNCHNLTSLKLSSFDTRNVKSMRGMFSVCRSLSSLDLSNFNTESLETTNEMFYYCSSLSSLDLSSFNTKNVNDMFIMFFACISLKTIYVSDQWTTASVTEGGRMFYGCVSLVGGKGTKFNAMNEDYTYAHIDEGPSNPGYLTRIGDEPYQMSWVDQLANGDAEKPWVNPDTRFDDLQNNYKICAWGKEKGVNMNNDGGWDPFPATIEEEEGTNGNHVFVVHGKTADTAGDASSWDNQFWIQSPQAWSVGTPIWIKFRYKASKNVVANTQVHKQTPSDYLHYEGIGDINFTTEWQQFNGIMTVKSEMDGFWSIAFNLNSNEKSATDFYFDDLSWSVYQEVVDTVAMPTFEFNYFYGDNLRMKTETEDAEIYYTVNGRMLQENDTDFGDGYLSGYNNRGWYVKGDNCSYSVPYDTKKDSYCLRLKSEKNDRFESAQATYIFSKFLTKGDYYTIHFKARSESGDGLIQFYCNNDTVSNSRSADETLTISKDWADYQVTVKIENDKTNQFVLNFGAIADTYYIDNVLFGPVISDTTNQMRTPYVDPVRLQDNVTVTAVAVKQGMADSKPAVFDYFYEGWQRLMFMYDWGRMVCDEVTGDPNVPLEMVDATRNMMDELMHHVYSLADSEQIEDTELKDHMYMMERVVAELYNMKRGFTIDGVSYHAVDSTQVEVIASLENYSPYRNAVTVAKEVHYNNIDFQVTSVAQGAFADSELGAIVWNPTVALKYEDVAVINNPNLLIYVNEASLAPENNQNIVVNKVAKNIKLVDTTNGNFYCPEPFTAEAISYTREFRQETQVGVSRGWEGIALPFDVQTITHEKSGTISPFSRNDNNKHFWLRRLSGSGLVPSDKMEANVPYIIAMPNSSEYPDEFNLPGRVTFSSANVTVPVTEARTLSLADSTIMMASTMQRLNRSSRYYALNVGEVRGQYLEGSVFERDYREIRPFEAYTIHNAAGPAPRFVPVLDMNGDATGIEDVRWQMSDGRSDLWYDLSGRRLQQKPTQKGVYLYDGRKVIIR